MVFPQIQHWYGTCPYKYSEERNAMKRMCAWCGLALDPSERSDELQVTRGLCQVCRRRFFASPRPKEADSRKNEDEDSGGPEDTCTDARCGTSD